MGKNKKLEERKKRVAAEISLLKKKGFTKHDITISGHEANLYGLFTPLPFMIVLLAVFILLYGLDYFMDGLIAWTDAASVLIISLVICLAFVVIHELIHGFFFGLAARSHFKAVEFGILWKSMNPYCCCTQAVSKIKYMIALLAPGFILGICIGVFGIVIANVPVLVLGILNLYLAGGDLCIALKIMKFSKRGRKELYLDHPEKPGSMGFTKGR